MILLDGTINIKDNTYMESLKKLFNSLPHHLTTGLIILAMLLISNIAPHKIFAKASDCPKSYILGESGTISRCDYIGTSQDDSMTKVVQELLGDVPNLTVTADMYKTNPAYVQNMRNSSVMSHLNGYIADLYKYQPASTYAFILDTGQNLGFISKQTYAQGIGFSGLAPILPIWKAFRNIAYMMLAVVMIVIGFMVMLRKKIDPKTVVTVQNALPKIIVTLILITFSYAIVGLMIDLLYLVLLLVISVLVGASNGALGADTATKYLNGGFGTVVSGLFWGGMKSMDDLVALIPGATGTAGGTMGAGGIIAGLIAGGTATTLGAFVLPVLAGIAAAPVIFVFLLSLVLLFSIVRILFMLIDAYIHIIISLIFAPIQLLTEAIPGSHGFENWIKNLFAKLIVFPVTAALMLIGTMLTSFEKNPMGIPGFDNQAHSLWSPPLLGSGGTHGMAGLIGLGVLLIIPNIVSGIEKALKSQPFIPGGTGSVAAPIQSVYGTAMGGVSQMYYINQLTASATGTSLFNTIFGKKSDTKK